MITADAMPANMAALVRPIAGKTPECRAAMSKRQLLFSRRTHI